MASNFCLKFKHDHVLTILLLVLVWLNYIATVISEANQVEAAVVMNKKCIDKERRALLDIKALILQDPKDRFSTWGTNEEDNCCEWRGVSCNDQTGHVTVLDLSNWDLEGEISPSLLNLTHLTRLDLSSNHFSKTVLMFIGSLTQLSYLDLTANSFNGTIPMSIGSLTQLSIFDLSFNSFTGAIPMSIGSLNELRYLDLSDNYFEGTIPMSIGSLNELRYLDLSGNSFNGTIPMSIGSLNELRYIDLSSKYFKGNIPMFIGSDHDELIIYDDIFYDISSGNIPGIILPDSYLLGNMRKLSLRNMGSCRVENLDWLSNLSHLQYLNMDGISLAKANHWVNIVTSLQNLTYLSLEGCNLSQVMYPYSSSYVNSSFTSSSILDLYLGDNNLNSSISHWLFPLTSNMLSTLDLSANMLDGIPKYLGNLSSLTTLYLNRNSALVNFSDFLNNLSGCTSATLKSLDASSSQFIGSLSDDIQNFSSLYDLNLAHNQLNGTISEKVWELPNLGQLDVSSNSLRGAISENIVQSTIGVMVLSNNLLQGVTFKPQKSKSNFSYVKVIDLSSCKIGPRFPRWIHTLRNLTHLNVARSGISDTIPAEFWDMWPSQLMYLNLSSNNISGKVPDLSSNFNYYAIVDLSSNNFYGPVPNVSSILLYLDLSKNNFYGGISFICILCQASYVLLEHLDLSNNSFSGQLPDCLSHFTKLRTLNLGDNNFSGRLPTSVRYLIALEVLSLHNNGISGELPLSLRNCTNLTFLDLGNNRLTGNVPVWIGEDLSWLYVLSLSKNNFSGPIPVQICQLLNLQILDLSMNNLYGTIPTCVNNLTAMVQQGILITQNVHNFGFMTWLTSGLASTDHLMIDWQGNIREFSSNLGFLKSIDLSSNNLTGQIPNELTDLRGLLALNLSKNALVGEIPHKIGEMKKLLTLDLSRNNLSGGLPSNMSQMSSLNYLDVAYNNFSGKIPSSTQLQSFEPSRYTGNAGLCGPPVTVHCLGDKELQVSPPIGESQGDGADKDELERLFYIGGTTGFAIGFWIVCSVLLVNRRGRHSFFHFLDSLENWVYVKVMVYLAKFQSAGHTS